MDSDALTYKDKHSDERSWQRCQPEVQEVLTAAGMVKFQRLPEEHMTWTSRASNHDLLRRPSALAVNTRGDVIVAEVDNHVLLMYTRHVPVKLKVAAGQWGEPGAASNGDKVKMKCPTALAMLIVVPGKKELCYFVDSGNCFRVLHNAHSFDATQTVETQTVRLSSADPDRLEPLGIALINQSLLAISEDTKRRVRIAHLDDTRVGGQFLSVLTWDNLVAPRGLAALDGSVFIADKTRVLAVSVTSGSGTGGRVVRDAATRIRRSALSQLQTDPFTDARAVAAQPPLTRGAATAVLAVADLGAHCVRLLSLRGFNIVSTRTLGTGVPAHVSGAIGAASFNEPLALAYAHGALHVGCYGGALHGSVSVVAPTAWAVRILHGLSTAYDAIGYVPPGATVEQRARRHPPVREAVGALAACGQLLEQASKARNATLGDGSGRGAEGPEGTWPLYQVEAIGKTATSVGEVLDAMEAQELSLQGVKLAAFVNESGMESSFGQADMRTQYKHPDQKHYVGRKPSALTRQINRCCGTPHSEHTGSNLHYQAPQQSSLSAMVVVGIVRRAWHALFPSAKPLDQWGKAQLKSEMQRAKQLQHVAAAQRTNNVRASNYAARCGYSPTVLLPNEVLVQHAGDNAPGLCIISLDEALRKMREGSAGARARAGQQTLDQSYTREKFVFVPGDVVFLEAGVIDDTDNPDGFVDATEPWWALQVTRPFERSKMRARCVLHGFWLNRVARSSACRWALLAGAEVPQRYGPVLKSASGQPVVVSSSELETGWSSANKLIYTLPDELITRLDGLAEEAANELEDGGDDGVASEAEGDGDEGGEEEGGVSGGESGGDDEGPSTAPPPRDRNAVRERREEARERQLAEQQARRDTRRAAQLADTEARRAALLDQLQGRAAGLDLAPLDRPRRNPRPIADLLRARFMEDD